MSSITVLLVTVAAASLLATEVRAQNNGDIRLVNYWKDGLSTCSGRLEIFIDGQWGTICGKRITKTVAEAVCRQLGFIPDEAVDYGTVIELGYPVPTIVYQFILNPSTVGLPLLH